MKRNLKIPLLLLLLFAAACTPARERAAELLGPEALCTTEPGTYACGRAIEDVLIVRDSARARRDAGALTLRVGEREGVSFADTPPGTPPERERRYTYRGLLAGPGFYLVQVHYAGDAGYALVSARTGSAVQVGGVPVFAPDGARFAVVREGGAEGRGDAQIWRVEEDAVALEWTYPAAGAALGAPVWLDSRTLRLVRAERDPAGTRERETAVTLRLEPGGWVAR